MSELQCEQIKADLSAPAAESTAGFVRPRSGIHESVALKVWASPTLMSILNTTSKVLSFAVVLPLILHRFSAGDVALFYLFYSLISLQMLVGGGFLPTFSRFFSQALAGVSASQLGEFHVANAAIVHSGEPDGQLLARIVGTLRVLFGALAVISVPVAALLGTALLLTPVQQSSSLYNSWIAWGIIVSVTPFALYSTQYRSILQGTGQIAAEQRWSALCTFVGAAISVLCLAVGGGLLAFVVATQSMQLVSFILLRKLASLAVAEIPFEDAEDRYDSAVFRAVWPGAWRSLIGVFMSAGIVSATGLVFAQFMNSIQIAEFLLAIRLMAIAAEISRAPFYSQIPRFNRLRAKGTLEVLRSSARRAMFRSHCAYLILFAIIPPAVRFVEPLINSSVEFPSIDFWIILGAAAFFERWGAMHLQLYSTTNHIVWHWLNGFTGLLWIALMLLSTGKAGVFSYPISMLIANVLIYWQISVRKSLNSLGCSFWEFERRCGIPATLGLSFLCAFLWILNSVTQ